MSEQMGVKSQRNKVQSRPRILDLFCWQGGAGMGYHRAGFEVIGVDIRHTKRYPFELHQADALEYLTASWQQFDAVHASPPCRDKTKIGKRWGDAGTGWLLGATRKLLADLPIPWVIENVPGADMRADLVICGCMVGLPRLRRERWFETSWHAYELRPPCHHPEPVISVHGHPGGSSRRDGKRLPSLADWKDAMGIDWMSRDGLAQAIPPAYTEHVGGHLMSMLSAQRKARSTARPAVTTIGTGLPK